MVPKSKYTNQYLLYRDQSQIILFNVQIWCFCNWWLVKLVNNKVVYEESLFVDQIFRILNHWLLSVLINIWVQNI